MGLGSDEGFSKNAQVLSNWSYRFQTSSSLMFKWEAWRTYINVAEMENDTTLVILLPGKCWYNISELAPSPPCGKTLVVHYFVATCNKALYFTLVGVH